jgi:hypothetical protein
MSGLVRGVGKTTQSNLRMASLPLLYRILRPRLMTSQ